VSWQDPSTDIANVNAAYRLERDENRRLREAFAKFAWSVEVDRRQPDKLLCHVASARRVLLDGELAAEAAASEGERP
jgi:hypothetical protein